MTPPPSLMSFHKYNLAFGIILKSIHTSIATFTRISSWATPLSSRGPRFWLTREQKLWQRSRISFKQWNTWERTRFNQKQNIAWDTGIKRGLLWTLTGLSRMKDCARRLLRKWSWANRMLSKSRVALICCKSCENWDSRTSTWRTMKEIPQIYSMCVVCKLRGSKIYDSSCNL